MRLPKELITVVSKGILKCLIEKRIISSDNLKDTQQKMERIILLDLEKDENYLKKAKEILDKRFNEIKSAKEVDYHLLLLKAKREVASKDNFLVWGGESKFPEDKVYQLSKDFVEFFTRDDFVEYYVKKDELLKEVRRAFELEIARDKKRENLAENKVKSIKRNIQEGSAEYETLKEQFYREFLLKEA